MQPNAITIQVDTQNNGNPTEVVLSRYDEGPNNSTYVTGDHSPGGRDQVKLFRTFPTKSGNFRGTSKSSMKFTKDTVVMGVDGISQLTVPVILEVSASVPIGITSELLCELRQRVISLLDSDTFMDDLQIRLSV